MGEEQALDLELPGSNACPHQAFGERQGRWNWHGRQRCLGSDPRELGRVRGGDARGRGLGPAQDQ